jgi:hypothetical protein
MSKRAVRRLDAAVGRWGHRSNQAPTDALLNLTPDAVQGPGRFVSAGPTCLGDGRGPRLG